MNQRSYKQPARQEGYPPRIEEIIKRQTLNELEGGKEELVIQRVGAEVSVWNNDEDDKRESSNPGRTSPDTLGVDKPEGRGGE